jgi:type IV pilus assembly protein PilW
MLKHRSRLILPLRRQQRGISLIELMVGITVGLIITAGAIVMTVAQLGEHRRLLLETQIQQDLRAAGDLMLRDLRRAGYWSQPGRGIWASGAAAPVPNAYTMLEQESEEHIEYSYSRAAGGISGGGIQGMAENDAVDDATEKFGFRLNDDELQFRLGNRWQPLTDKGVVKVLGFSIEPRIQTVPLAGYCEVPCADPANDSCLRQQLRHVDITLTGQAAHDANVVRTITVSSRLRNDQIEGACGT